MPASPFLLTVIVLRRSSPLCQDDGSCQNYGIKAILDIMSSTNSPPTATTALENCQKVLRSSYDPSCRKLRVRVAVSALARTGNEGRARVVLAISQTSRLRKNGF